MYNGMVHGLTPLSARGVIWYQGLDPAKETPGAELAHFAIRDAASKWYWAKAAIDGNSVLVWNDEVKNPTHVHFGYQSNPVGFNLYNKEGLPASPFTTE